MAGDRLEGGGHAGTTGEQVLTLFEEMDRRSPGLRRRTYAKHLAWVSVVRGSFLLKRGIDLLGASLLLLLLTPVFLFLALLIRLESPGPIFFRQIRVGKEGRIFTMWKFRSMYVDAERRKSELTAQNEMSGGVIFKMKDDPRITRVGRYLRKGSLDELPQLWNVLQGGMSLVGPRPPVPLEVEQYTVQDRRRLDVMPGITCLWQIAGRSEIPFDQQVELDVAYIHSQTLWEDLRILIKTVPAVLLGRGAY